MAAMPTASTAFIDPSKPAAAEGKRRLIAAALRLAARGSGLSSLGLRELAREAELNHNTFYRHFGDLEDLGRAAAGEIAAQLMAGMKEVRLGAARHADATIGAVDYYLDCVSANPDVFVVGARELHTAGSPMRRVLHETIEAIAHESVDQITALSLAPLKDRERLFRVALDITHYMLCRALDLLDSPDQREAIRREMIDYVRRQFVGAMSLQQTAASRR